MPPYDAERDLRILSAMVEQLEPYLYEDELFWPISGPVRGGLPRLTVGGLLLRAHRLETLRTTLDMAQQARLQTALDGWQTARSAWTIHYTGKMAREWDMRIHLLNEFLRDCERGSGGDCAANWPNQAEKRTILHHLLAELTDLHAATGAQEASLHRVDTGLRRFLGRGRDGYFFWAEALAPAYPRDPYWWLWTAPQDS